MDENEKKIVIIAACATAPTIIKAALRIKANRRAKRQRQHIAAMSFNALMVEILGETWMVEGRALAVDNKMIDSEFEDIMTRNGMM